MKSEKIKLFSIFLLCGSNFGTNLYADSSTNLDTNLSQAKLSDIVVTATKNPIKIAQVPANVAIATSEDIKAKAAATDVYKAIAHIAGVEPLGGGMSEAMYIRGKTPSVLSNGRDMNFFSGIMHNPDYL